MAHSVLPARSPSIIRNINNWARYLTEQGHSIADGTIGAPSHPANWSGVLAAVRMLGKSLLSTLMEKISPANRLGYTAFQGDKHARVHLAETLRHEYEIPYNAEDIVLTCGATGALGNAFGALVAKHKEQGGESPYIMLTPAPYYALYKPQMELAGGKLQGIDVSGEGFRITAGKLRETFESLKGADGTVRCAVLFDYPGNPIGTALNKQDWEEIAAVLRDYPHVEILMDEIYREVYFGEGDYISLLHVAPDLKDRTVMIFSGSKGAGMPGLRIGATASSHAMAEKMANRQMITYVHPSLTAQFAYVHAVRDLALHPEKKRSIAEFYRKKIDYLQRRFAPLGILLDYDIKGAFYLVINLAALKGMALSSEARAAINHGLAPQDSKFRPEGYAIRTDEDIAYQLLFLPGKKGIAIVPGSGFGMDPDACLMRISCIGSPRQLRAIAEGIETALKMAR